MPGENEESRRACWLNAASSISYKTLHSLPLMRETPLHGRMWILTWTYSNNLKFLSPELMQQVSHRFPLPGRSLVLTHTLPENHAFYVSVSALPSHLLWVQHEKIHKVCIQLRTRDWPTVQPMAKSTWAPGTSSCRLLVAHCPQVHLCCRAEWFSKRTHGFAKLKIFTFWSLI